MNEIGLTNWLMKIVNVTGLDQDAATGSISNYLTPATQPPSVTDDKDITGFDALVLDYAMPFPLSLVVSRVTLTRYQLLFRYLLSLRHLETLLVGSWSDHSKVLSWKHRSKNPQIEMWKRKAWTLRARMLVFVQQLLYYCTAEVIEPNWVSLMARLNEGNEDVPQKVDEPAQVKRTVDELMQDHVDFLATCLKECMLTNSKLLRVCHISSPLLSSIILTIFFIQINSKILATCTMFANFTSSLSRYLVAADPDLANSSTAAPANVKPSHGHSKSSSTSVAYDPAKVNKMFDILNKYEDNFARHLKILLDTLNYLAATETVVFLSLCARLSTASEGTPGPERACTDEK
jgi:gamma-tubulin complex component 2